MVRGRTHLLVLAGVAVSAQVAQEEARRLVVAAVDGLVRVRVRVRVRVGVGVGVRVVAAVDGLAHAHGVARRVEAHLIRGRGRGAVRARWAVPRQGVWKRTEPMNESR